MIPKLARAGAWLLAIVIVVLSVVPPQLRPVVGPHDLEHAGIFIALGVSIGLGYRQRRAAAIVSVLFCAAVEFAQLWVPGRHARIEDLIVDIAAALVGLGAATLVRAGREARPLPARRGAKADTDSVSREA